MKPTFPRIALILFASGFCSLVYQIAWLRLLRLVFGVSTAATAVVLAIFMGGLGLGGYLLGRRAERLKNPLAFYARLEIGIALTAALSPLLIALGRNAYLALGGVDGLGLGFATLVRLLLAVAILGLPTTLMGGTLPAVARSIERNTDRGRRRVAVLYGVNTFGAVIGAFLSTFLLLELFGVRQSLWLAAALNLLLALVVRAMARQAAEDRADDDIPADTVAPEPHPDGDAAPEDDSDTRPAAVRLILVAAFAVGFVFFLMELVWYRMLAPILGGSSYTFGLILSVALAGIAGGGALYGLGSQNRRPTLRSLAWTCLLEALALALPFALGDDLAYVTAMLRFLAAFDFVGLVLAWTVTVTIVVLPAAIVAGYQFPLLVALLGAGRHRVAAQVGLAYAWNTWGAILGSLLGGFVLLPRLTAPRLWTFSAAILLVLGLLLSVLGRRRGHNSADLLAPAAVALAGVALCLAPGPSDYWRHQPIGAGRITVEASSPNDLRAAKNETRRVVVREAEGIESSIALRAEIDLALLVNGKSDGAAIGDAPTTVMLGLVGAALHPEPRRALVVGLGTGATAGWLAQVETIERVDVIELEPAVGELAEVFAPVQQGLLENPRVRMIYGDGREYVLTTDETYDLIVSEPSNPYRTGVADLFSRDFYDAATRRLRPGGLFVQWLQGYEVDAPLIRTVYATLGSVFPAVETWQPLIADLLLVGSAEPILHDYDRIRRTVTQEPFRTAVRRLWRVDGLAGFYSGFAASDVLTDHLAGMEGGRVSSDDHPHIEFGFARTVGRRGFFNPLDLHLLARHLGAERPMLGRGEPPDERQIALSRHSRAVTGSFPDLPPAPSDEIEHAWWTARRAYSQGDLERVRQLLLAHPREPQNPLEHFMLTESLADQATEDAPGEVGTGDEVRSRLDALRNEAPTEAALLEARYAWRSGDFPAAVEYLTEGFKRIRRDPWVFQLIFRRSLDLVLPLAEDAPGHAPKLFAALAEPFVVRLDDETRKHLRVKLLAHLDLTTHCAEVFEEYEPHVLWEKAFLLARASCYEINGRPLRERAWRELEEFIAAAPSPQLDPIFDGGQAIPTP